MGTTEYLNKLDEFESQLRSGKGDFKKIYDLITSLQTLESREQVIECREKVIPELIPFLFLLVDEAERRRRNDPNFDDRDVDILTMRMLAGFQSLKGIEAIAEFIKKNHKKDCYWWTTVLNYYVNEKEPADVIVRTLDGKLPDGFLGIVYLDMLNKVCREDETFRPHPFSCSEGVIRLEHYLTNDQPEEYSYAFSATSALPFMSKNVWNKLLPVALKHPDQMIRLEALWAGTKLGNEECRACLIEAAKDYRFGGRAVQYLEELGLAEWIPEESQTDEFAVLSEMSSWLAHPSEMGAYPTELAIVDSRTLYWPPMEDERQLVIVRYRYDKWNDDGSDEVGVGLVGSTTFCLFGTKGLNERTPEEIYAIHCGWEMRLDHYMNPEVGMAVLAKHNPGFGIPGHLKLYDETD